MKTIANQYLRPALGLILLARILVLGESIPTQAEIRMLAVGAALAVGIVCFLDIELVEGKAKGAVRRLGFIK